MSTAIHKKIRLAEAGDLPAAIIRMPSGWVIAGDVQPLTGYCVFLRDPVVSDLNALSLEDRKQYAIDTSLVGDALMHVLGAYRINYEIWGNQDPALHTHIVPRYLNEPDDLRVKTPRQAYDWNSGRIFTPTDDKIWITMVGHWLRDHSHSKA